MKRILTLLFLCLCLNIPVYSGGLTDTAGSLLKIDSRVTWTSVFQPEVHLLLRNTINSDLPVIVRIGYSASKKIICAKNIDNLDIHHTIRTYNADRYSYIETNGIVNKDGWLHRSFPLGKNGLIAPCKVPYQIHFPNSDRTPIEGVIDVPGRVGLEHGGEVSNKSLEVDHIVETFDSRSGHFILRLLVTNKEAHTFKLRVTDIDLTCDADNSAKVSLHRGPQNGLRFGPFYIRGHRWGTFEIPIDVSRLEEADKCRGWVELSVDKKPGHIVPLKKVAFALIPNGIYSIVTDY